MNDATLLIVFTVVEIAALVAVLAVALLLVERELRAIGEEIERTSENVGALGGELGDPPGAAELNYALEQIAQTLPGLAERAERLGAGGR